ncbi:regenerating islet-derived protein 3-gamma-like isoform X1 [Suncus etruscus]|uniref:regenerating islet-derived protein 3-gamma-like isoform X1 n=1 Tax=Suncus etruscus TaxID=109475 RepID=UPI00210FC758|nr:regenerating islet-derived protein 3-gamma-like isoform X1 [Suncus etruscus]
MLSSMAVPSFAWKLLSCLMLLSQVKGEDLQKVEVAPRIRCPTGSVAYGSYCYALFLSKLSWPNAEIACQKQPLGHLVSVLTWSEASFLSSLINSTLDNYYDVWIGLHDPTEGREASGAGWEWSSTDAMNYLAWELNTPTISDSGFCGSVTKSSGFLKWKDYNCDLKLPFVCKFKA